MYIDTVGGAVDSVPRNHQNCMPACIQLF